MLKYVLFMEITTSNIHFFYPALLNTVLNRAHECLPKHNRRQPIIHSIPVFFFYQT